jgi:peptidoglycan/xylan/chitin deacetylase (PgdA/CDA1 family)
MRTIPAREETFINRNADVGGWRPRDAMRHVAISSLALLQDITNTVVPLPTGNGIHFLYLHHVFEDEIESFRGLVDTLGRDYRFISYSEAHRRIVTGNIDDRYVAFSFDDGLACTLNAANVLSEYGVSACFFLATGIIGIKDPAIIARFCRDRLKFAPARFMGWDDVNRLIENGHEIGGHTRSHANLGKVSDNESSAEIEGCFEDLQQRIGRPAHFAWPFGRFSDVTAHAASTVFRAGFISCASAERGCHAFPLRSGFDSLCVRRDMVRAGWPRSHIRYFLRRSRQRASPLDNAWPAALSPGDSNADSAA